MHHKNAKNEARQRLRANKKQGFALLKMVDDCKLREAKRKRI
jgi:hypothetical protein